MVLAVNIDEKIFDKAPRPKEITCRKWHMNCALSDGDVDSDLPTKAGRASRKKVAQNFSLTSLVDLLRSVNVERVNASDTTSSSSSSSSSRWEKLLRNDNLPACPRRSEDSCGPVTKYSRRLIKSRSQGSNRRSEEQPQLLTASQVCEPSNIPSCTRVEDKPPTAKARYSPSAAQLKIHSQQEEESTVSTHQSESSSTVRGRQPLPPPIIKATRVPRELQMVFLASNRGENVDKPPSSGAIFARRWPDESVRQSTKKGQKIILKEDSDISEPRIRNPEVSPKADNNSDAQFCAEAVTPKTLNKQNYAFVPPPPSYPSRWNSDASDGSPKFPARRRREG